MSEMAAEPKDSSLWLEQQLAQVARAREETRKFLEEGHKLQAETMKLHAEALKLDAEAMKLHRDRGLAPWLAIVGLVGGLLAIANFALRFVH